MPFHLFTRKRTKTTQASQAPFRHVKGDIFTPGAEVFAFETEQSDPAYTTKVFPQWNFTPLRAYQPPMVFQYLSLPQNPLQGFPYSEIDQQSLIQETDYPDVSGEYYS